MIKGSREFEHTEVIDKAFGSDTGMEGVKQAGLIDKASEGNTGMDRVKKAKVSIFGI